LAVFPIPELSAKSTGIPKKLLISSFISFTLLIALKPYFEAKSGVASTKISISLFSVASSRE
jgi:membrane-associated HD superfamily phosphohydrolase